jgi:hypothetical protein
VRAIEALRRLRMTAAEISEVLGLPLSTVSLWLQRSGLGKRSRLEPPEPPNRYERRHPGELMHVDIKQLGRISVLGAGHRMVGHRKSQINRIGGEVKRLTGFEYVHVMVDDHSRVAYAEVLEDLTARCAIAFLERGRGLVCRARGQGQGRDDRQRLRLQSSRPPRGLARARDQARAHQAGASPHQWESRTLHPDAG